MTLYLNSYSFIIDTTMEKGLIEDIAQFIDVEELNSPYLQMIENLSDPAIFIYMDEYEDFDTMKLIGINTAAKIYYRENKLDFSLGTNIQEVDIQDISKVGSFISIQQSIKHVYRKLSFEKPTNLPYSSKDHVVVLYAGIQRLVFGIVSVMPSRSLYT